MDKNYLHLSIFYKFTSVSTEKENSLINKKSVKLHQTMEPGNQRFQ